MKLNQPLAAGTTKSFFDSSVAAQSTNGSKAPEKAAPKQAAPTKVSSGGGFFDSSVGAHFATRSESPRKAAPKPAAAPRASSGKGFFESSVGAQFANRSESPKKAAPTSSPSGKLLALLLPSLPRERSGLCILRMQRSKPDESQMQRFL